MTTSDLNGDIRRALDAATPAPWDWTWNLGMREVLGDAEFPTNVATPYSDADAHLIANAPAWLASLLAERDRLASELAASQLEVRRLQHGRDVVVRTLESAGVTAPDLPGSRASVLAAAVVQQLAETQRHFELAAGALERIADQASGPDNVCRADGCVCGTFADHTLEQLPASNHESALANARKLMQEFGL